MPVRVADLFGLDERTARAGDRLGSPSRGHLAGLASLDPGRLLTQATAAVVTDALVAAKSSAIDLAFNDGALGSRLASLGHSVAHTADPSWPGTRGVIAGISGIDVESSRWADPGMAITQLHDGDVTGRAVTSALSLNGVDSAMMSVSLGAAKIADLAITGRMAETDAIIVANRLASAVPDLTWSMALGPNLDLLTIPQWNAVVEVPPIPWLAPGTPDADLHLLLHDEGEPEERLAALERMVDRVPWAPRGAAKRALWARSRHEEVSPVEIKRRELRAAVFLVLGDVEAPQYHRFGTRWLVGQDGRRHLVRPYHDLDLDLLWEWFFDEVVKAAEAALLERPYPATGDPLEPDKDAPGRIVAIDGNRVIDPAGDPLLLLLEHERQSEDAARLLGALRAASPRQRELLALIGAGDSPTEAGRRLGMAPGTARAQLHRLRQKLV